jgi:hypothetical protein
MNNTEMKINQPSPVLVYNINTGSTNLAFDVQNGLNEYSKIYITKQFDPFRIVYCGEYPFRDYMIYGLTKEGERKNLFNAIYHYQCCNCCDQYIIGCLLCGYACCDSIQTQIDYKKDGMPFYTQGYNITKGCHCCDIFLLCENCGCGCTGKKLYLRENVDPDSPDIRVGVKKGKTITNCCCACDKFVKYETENHLKGPTVRAECCNICLNTCVNSFCCGCCVSGFDFEMKIEDENNVETGKVTVFSGCCSKKVEGMCCRLPRAYFEVDMPANASSEQKFQIIADIIHFNEVNKLI